MRNCFVTGGLPPAHKWTIRRKHISRAIRQSKNSAPGPDNIPSRIWKALGELGVTTPFEATQELHQTGARNLLVLAYSRKGQIGSRDFNAGLLCCLPKKPTGAHEQHGEYYGPGDTRPLAIVNTDSRIIASACRLAWEPLMNDCISKMQRGFLKGRSMLMNVQDIDENTMTVS